MPDPTYPDLGSSERRYSESLKSPTEQADLDSAEKRFGDEKLFAALREAKPSAIKDGQSLFPTPEPTRTQDELRRSDQPRGSVRHLQRQAPFPPEITSETTQVTGGRQITPFFVTKREGTGAFAGQDVLNIYPGKIASIVPTVNGVKLDNDPQPQQSIGGATAPFSLFLRAKISVDTNNLFRDAIDTVKVCTDNDADVIPDIVGSEVPEMFIFWEDPPTNTTGHFYIKIADITVSGASKVTGTIQWLFSSYATFVATGTEAIVII